MDIEQYLISQFHSDYIGDDGAVISETIYSMDAFCEDTHFRRAWMSPTQIGRKAMLVNLSDAVAMNADPRFALVSIAVPKDFSADAIAELTGALEATAAEWGTQIIGGDTVGSDKLHLAITLISHSEAPLLRTGLQEGDLLAYTGELGGSRRDLLRLEAGEPIGPDSRFYLPTLRRDFIRRARSYLRAGMDISDGLFCDTNKLLDMNKYGINILKNISSDVGQSGEEYEMLIAFDPRNQSALERLANSMDLPLTIFGTIAHNSDRFPCQSHHFG